MTINTKPGLPMSPRDHNRLAVMELVFREPGIVRSEVQHRTGLSRATIFRIVDELTSDGYLSEAPEAGARSRGRPKLKLSVSPGQGHVVGVDIGVLTTRMMVGDLNGVVLARRLATTPRGLSPTKLSRWLGTQVREMCAEAADYGSLVRAVVSLPAKVGADQEVTRPAGHLAYLAGSSFGEAVGAELGVPTRLRSDPDMALRGEMLIGHAAGYSDVVMFVMGSALSASVAIDGRTLHGRRGIIGEFGALPLDDERSLANVLTVTGVLAAARNLGIEADDIPALLAGLDAETRAVLEDGVRRGLVAAFSAVTLSVDPELIVVTGSLLPLVSAVLPQVTEELQARLPGLPKVALSETGGFSQPRGALDVALTDARAELLDTMRPSGD